MNCFLDLETVPTDAALAMAPDEEYLLRGVASNWKPETVEAHREKRRLLWPSEIAKMAALDWRLGRIAAIGLAVDDAPVYLLDAADEGLLLTAFWRTMENQPAHRIVGFRVRTFDLPYLLGRTGVLGLRATRTFDLRKYGGPVIDWAELLGENLTQTGWTLGRYAEHFALPEQTYGKGEDVFPWWLAGNMASIRQHLEQDVKVVRALHQRFAPAWGLPATIAA